MAESLLVSSSSFYCGNGVSGTGRSKCRATFRTSINPIRHRPSPASLRRSQTASLDNKFAYRSNVPPLTPPCLHQFHHRRSGPPPSPALDSPDQLPVSQELQQWDTMTAKFSGAANIPFLVLQLPQIILNAQNLLSGNKAALLAVPWLGMLTGLMGNLSLLSYFIKKREKEAVVVQTLGVVSIYVVLCQLAAGEAMPLPHFLAISAVVAAGLILNFMNYFGILGASVWRLWEISSPSVDFQFFLKLCGLRLCPAFRIVFCLEQLHLSLLWQQL